MIAALAIAVAIGGFAQAAEVKMAGKLNAPANASVIAICTDPVVQNVLNEDLRVARHGAADESRQFGDAHGDGESTNARARSVVESDVPGRPFDGRIAEGGRSRSAAAGRRGQSTGPSVRKRGSPPGVGSRRSGDGGVQSLPGAPQCHHHGPTPYDSIPKNQLYDTAIVARASLEGAVDELKVVAVVHSGDDARHAKELVAEEIANAVLH